MVVAVNKFITLNNQAAATVVWSQHRHSSHGNFLNWPRPQSPLLGHNTHRARIYLTNCFRRLFPATGCHRNCWGARGNGPGQKVKLFLDLELGFWSTSSLTFCRLSHAVPFPIVDSSQLFDLCPALVVIVGTQIKNFQMTGAITQMSMLLFNLKCACCSIWLNNALKTHLFKMYTASSNF